MYYYGEIEDEYDVFYYYDENGSPIGLNRNDTDYYYYKNIFGDILGIMTANGTVVVRYAYDAWGNAVSVTGSMASTLGQQNRFRYRSYYYEAEIGLYYLQSRYYDPNVGRFISPDDISYLGADGTPLSYNLFCYCGNDPVNRFDPTGTMPEWLRYLLFGIAVIGTAALLTCFPETYCFGVGALKGSLIGGALFGGAGAFYGAVSGEDTLLHASRGFAIGTAVGFLIGGMTSDVCFVAGTLVQTENGAIPIEQIAAGDLVWATDPESGETALKPVAETYVRETDELVHVHLNGSEIVCTPEHPFYSPVKGWTAACKLRAGDVLRRLNGEYVVVEFVQHELLESPVAVYNFQVSDFHTYYVGDTDVLAHNDCKEHVRFTDDQDAVIQLAKECKKTGLTSSDANTLWSWVEEYDLAGRSNFHPPQFDRYLKGMQKHMKINGMHINVWG